MTRDDDTTRQSCTAYPNAVPIDSTDEQFSPLDASTVDETEHDPFRPLPASAATE
jgi:hypothetical protein